MAALLFFLTLLREAGNELQVANHTGSVVQILAIAYRTLNKPVFTDISTSFAQGIVNIEGKVAASGLDCCFQK